MDLGQLGDVVHLGEQVVLALVAQRLLELERQVEVVLDRRLAGGGDQQDVVDSPAATHSSTMYWIVGRSTIGSSSFGTALVAGRNRVP